MEQSPFSDKAEKLLSEMPGARTDSDFAFFFFWILGYWHIHNTLSWG